MTPKQFIEKALEGGWKASEQGEGKTIEHVFFPAWFEKVLLDPLAWAAVGKVEGWGHEMKGNGIPIGTYPEAMVHVLFHKTNKLIPVWQFHMHQMITALCEGKSIEQFLETL